MSELGDLLRELRGKRSLREIADITELSHTYISDVEKGYRRGTKKPIHPSPETLKRFAEAYNYPYEKLMIKAGYIENEVAKNEVAENKTPYNNQLTEKDESDIARRIEKLRHDLQHSEGLAFDGEPMSEESRESLLEAMEFGIRLAKKNNKKYIPKKYRTDEE